MVFFYSWQSHDYVAMHSQGSEINSQTQSFDAYRNSFLRVISVIIEIINYPFKLGKMRLKKNEKIKLACI
jgi:hypothetical protein